MKGIHGEMPTRQDSCDTHGEFTSTNYLGKIWSKCPKCSEIEKREHEKQERIEEERRLQEHWLRKLDGAAIPPRFKDKSLETYTVTNEAQRKVHEYCIKYATEFDKVLENGRSMMLCGRPGTGKTHLAIGIAKHVMKEHRKTALFVTVMRAVRRIKSTWGKDSAETENEAIAAYTSPDLLILDEVGVQFGSETEENFIFDIINERYENMKPTIIISNLSADGVKKYLGERVYDRLKDGGGAVIPFTWESDRK